MIDYYLGRHKNIDFGQEFHKLFLGENNNSIVFISVI